MKLYEYPDYHYNYKIVVPTIGGLKVSKERGISGAGATLVALGVVVSLGLWMGAIFGMPSATNENLAKLPPVAIDPLASSSGGSNSSSSSSSSASTGTSSSTSGGSSGTQSASGGYSSGGFTGLPFLPQSPKSKTLLDTSMPGYTIFNNTCSGCHGSDLEGGVGPELRGMGNVANESKVVSFITSGKGMMPPGGGLTSSAQIKQVADWLMKQTQK